MRNVAILGIVCLGTLGLMSGCDGESGTTGGAGGAGGSDASSSSSSSSGTGGSTSSSSSSGMGGMGGGGGAGGGGGTPVNGCTSYEDHLADTKVTISVGANGFTYSPACIRVKKGTDVNFVGAFSTHPTVGGVASPPTPDSGSPIKQTNSGTSVTFTMDFVGTYPFYCEYHAPSMAGAVLVE